MGKRGRKPLYENDLLRRVARNEFNKERRRIKRESEKFKAKLVLKYVKEEVLQYQWDYPIAKSLGQTVSDN